MAPSPKGFMRHWFAIEAIPLYSIIGFALAGGAWFMYRQAHSPSVVWTKSNPEPWNSIKPNETVKMLNVNEKLDKSWNRDKL